MPPLKRPPGLLYGDAAAPIKMALFVDPLCPDCLTEWNTLEEAMKARPEFNITVHMLALPYHTWAYVISQVVLAVKAIDAEKAKHLLVRILVDQAKFWNEPMSDKTQNEVTREVIEYAAEQTQLAVEEITERFNSREVIVATRMEFKYCAQMGISATPTVFINGVRTAITEDVKAEQVIEVIQSLL